MIDVGPKSLRGLERYNIYAKIQPSKTDFILDRFISVLVTYITYIMYISERIHD